MVFLSVPCDPIVITTDGSGFTAGRQLVASQSLVDDWDTKFGNTFQEYRIRGVTFDINALAPVSGITMFSIQEDNFAVPSYDSMTSATNWIVPNSSDNPRSRKVIRWKAIDLENLEYKAIDSSPSQAALTWFTNSVTFNSPASEPIFVVRATALVEFRGIGVPP